MSRMADILDNHQNLDQLFSLIKHYGISAEFVSDALIQHFEQSLKVNPDSPDADDQAYTQEVVGDLKQFYSRF